MIEFFLVLSLILNVGSIWYATQLIKRFLSISDELENLFVYLEEYSKHVDIVYNLERFYGDSTLENLMKHSKSVTSLADNFRLIYDIDYQPENIKEEEEEGD